VYPRQKPRTISVLRRAARCCVALIVLAVPAAAGASSSDGSTAPVVAVDGGKVRGAVADGVQAFRGIPYAAPPTGRLRWRAPQPPAAWRGDRAATAFGPACPQPETPFGPYAKAEDCLSLNVTAPAPANRGGRPVLVWIHGGGFTLGSGEDYDATKLAQDGTVVVTINYRLGALGFLAHPALADRPGGAAGNYGLMDQQAALRWVRRNIRGFGGDPRNVTIAGQSAGGLSVLMHLIARGSGGLFQRAIVQSGSFAPRQQSLDAAEQDGTAFAAAAGCPDQAADCLRGLPVADLVAKQTVGIPGVIDGKVLTRSVGPSLRSGRFHRVPIINGSNHDEERLFIALGSAVSGGRSVPLPPGPVDVGSYERVIGVVLGVSAGRAEAIAREYPVDQSPSPVQAFSTLVSDANFACPALEQNRWTARRVPTFAYEFDDDAAPERFVPQIATPTVATHQSELQYLFDLPFAPLAGALSSEQLRLAATMRGAWAGFAATGAPPRHAWPAFGLRGERVLSLVAPQPAVVDDFAARHHCGFWARMK
jgi:para-nitrobenzyl esterase